MTAREMQRKVEQRLLLLEVDIRKIKSQDIFDWINAGQHIFMDTRVDSIRQNNADNFAKIQKEIDDLRLITLESPPISGAIIGSRKEYTLPNQYRHLISSRVEVIVGVCTAKYKRARFYDPSIIDEINEERLYRPSSKSPTATLIGNKLHIYFDSKFSLGNAIITHIKTPTTIGISTSSGTLVQVNCELAEHTHEDIVELAVQYASRVLNVNQPQNS